MKVFYRVQALQQTKITTKRYHLKISHHL